MKKRAITLLEVMIVVLLIGIIGSVLGYNMKGSLDEGKAFKTREGAKQIHDILVMQISDEAEMERIVKEKDRGAIEKALATSGLVANPKNLLVDGWGNPYIYDLTTEGDLTVTSERLKTHEEKKNRR